MNYSIGLRGLCVALLSLTLSASSLMAAPAKETRTLTPAQRAEIGDLVRAYILDHPEVIVEAMNALQAKQDKAAKEKAAAVIKSRPNDVYNDGFSFVAGNPKAKVTLVEFFDYNCGYCKKALDKMMTLAKPDSNVRFVFKEFPILSADSELASKAAFAAKKQGKYLEFHRAMMAHTGRANEAAITDVAKSIGLNLDKFRKDIKDPAAAAHVASNLKLGEDLAIDGTPSFIVDGKILNGWSEDDLKKLIAGDKKI